LRLDEPTPPPLVKTIGLSIVKHAVKSRTHNALKPGKLQTRIGRGVLAVGEIIFSLFPHTKCEEYPFKTCKLVQ